MSPQCEKEGNNTRFAVKGYTQLQEQKERLNLPD